MDTLPPHASESNHCFVYELVDPRDMSVFYVGITVNLYKRFKQHMQCDGINPQKDARVQEILNDGHLVIMRTLEKTTVENARKRENWWIWSYRVKGVRLLNITVPRMKYKGLKPRLKTLSESNVPHGRGRTFSDVINMLVAVRETKQWPDEVSEQMRRHYRRTYPEFFQNSKKSARMREVQTRKAARIDLERRQR